MTDIQLMHYIESIKSSKDNTDVNQFLNQLSVMSGTGNGIGVATVKKLKDFAIREGFINA